MPAQPTDADLSDFLDECGWKATTLTNAANILRRWERWLGTRTPAVAVMDATHRELRAYLAERAGAAGPATVHKDWQVITAVYAWAARPLGGTVVTSGRYRGKRLPGAAILRADPMVRCYEPEVPETPKVRMADEADVITLIEHFCDTARKRHKGDQAARARRNAAMVALMFRSGCRVGELPWIDLEHLVRDADGTIVACHVGGDDGTHAKSGRRRLVPVRGETPKLLERYLRLRGTAPGPLFVGRQAHTRALDNRLTAGAIRDVVDRAATRLGIVISPHDMRRGFAVDAKRRGVDVVSIKEVGGWSSDAILKRYFGEQAGVLAVEAFHAVDAGPRAAPRLQVVAS